MRCSVGRSKKTDMWVQWREIYDGSSSNAGCSGWLWKWAHLLQHRSYLTWRQYAVELSRRAEHCAKGWMSKHWQGFLFWR